MSDQITRRDFLDGVALTIAAGVAPLDLLAQDPTAPAYPPALTGLRGQHDGSFEVAHGMRFEGDRYRVGGHARRNEFSAGDRLLISYGGSESLQSPAANFSPVVRQLMQQLGVVTGRFQTYFDQSLYPGLGLSRGSFFDRDRFGVDRLVVGDPTDWVADDVPRERRNGRPIDEFIDDFPMSAVAREQLKSLYGSKHVALERFRNVAEREEFLAGISYAAFLRREWGLSEEAIAYFGGRTLDFFALPPNQIPALDAAYFAYPGFNGIRLPVDDSAAAEMEEPYIYHFPDGNASIARLLVRGLIPDAAPGSTMEEIVLARLRYATLDRPRQTVRIRLNSTVVRVVNGGAGVEVGYVGNAERRLHRVGASHAVLACFNSMIPYLLGGIDSAQSNALQLNVKAPLVYSKVLVRDWRPWAKLGVHEIYGVNSHHSRVKLDYPVSIGGYRAPRSPDEPMVLHLVHVPTAPGIEDPRAALRAARGQLLHASFADHESAIRRDLSGMLAPGGFDDGRDILAITVNRWSHGYSWGMNTLVDEPDAAERAIRRARQPLGGVTIANSDAGWSA